MNTTNDRVQMRNTIILANETVHEVNGCAHHAFSLVGLARAAIVSCSRNQQEALTRAIEIFRALGGAALLVNHASGRSYLVE
jgi:hypothetical protein